MPVDTYLQDQWFKTAKAVEQTAAAAIVTDAGAATYTAAQVLGGVILRDCVGAGRTDVLPTAALLVGAMRAPRIGDTINVLIVNTSDAAETITVAAGSGGAFPTEQIVGTRIIPQNTSRNVLIRVTGVGSSAAYVCVM